MNPPSGWTSLDIDDPGAGSVPGPGGGVHAVAMLAASKVREEGWSSRAALEIARGWGAQGTRVVLFDVGLEEPSLHTAAGLDNLEGVSDALLFGSSFQRLAQPLSDGLFIATAGTAVPDGEALRLHPRWRDYVEGFREAGAVLVLYLPHDAPGADALLTQCDAVVVLADPEEAPGVAVPGSLELLATVGPAEPEPAAVAEPDLPVVPLSELAPEAPAEATEPAEAEDLLEMVPLSELAPEAPAEATEPAEAEDSLEMVPLSELAPEAPAEPTEPAEDEVPEMVPLSDLAPDAPAESWEFTPEDVTEEAPSSEDTALTLDEPADEEAAPSRELLEVTPISELAPDDLDLQLPADPLAGDPQSVVPADEDDEPSWSDEVAWEAPEALEVESEALAGEASDPLATTDPLAATDPLEAPARDTEVGEPAESAEEPVAPTLEDILADQAEEGPDEETPDAAEVAAAAARTSKPEKRRSSSAPLLFLILLLTVLAALIAGWLGYVEIPFITPAATGSVGTADAAEVVAAPEPRVGEAVETGAEADPSTAEPGVPGGESPVAAFVLALGAFGDLDAAWNRANVYRLQLRDVQFIVAPVEVGGTPYYRLLAGPAADSAELSQVRERLVAAQTGGGADDWIIREARLAYLVGAAPRLPLAERNVEILRELGIPAHVLRYTNAEGTTVFRVYSGAYADSAEAAYLGRVLADNSIRNVPLTERRGLRPE